MSRDGTQPWRRVMRVLLGESVNIWATAPRLHCCAIAVLIGVLSAFAVTKFGPAGLAIPAAAAAATPMTIVVLGCAVNALARPRSTSR